MKKTIYVLTEHHTSNSGPEVLSTRTRVFSDLSDAMDSLNKLVSIYITDLDDILRNVHAFSTNTYSTTNTIVSSNLFDITEREMKKKGEKDEECIYWQRRKCSITKHEIEID